MLTQSEAEGGYVCLQSSGVGQLDGKTVAADWGGRRTTGAAIAAGWGDRRTTGAAVAAG